jgi:predicted O-methyltransferase YrrM
MIELPDLNSRKEFDIRHGRFLAGLAAFIRPRKYLELGLFKGETLERVAPWCAQVHGVDINMQLSVRKIRDEHAWIELFEMEAFEYLEMAGRENWHYDLILVDDCHDGAHVIRELSHVAQMVNKGGIIAVHDTHPTSPGSMEGVKEFMQETGPKLELVTVELPYQHGMTLWVN